MLETEKEKLYFFLNYDDIDIKKKRQNKKKGRKLEGKLLKKSSTV